MKKKEASVAKAKKKVIKKAAKKTTIKKSIKKTAKKVAKKSTKKTKPAPSAKKTAKKAKAGKANKNLKKTIKPVVSHLIKSKPAVKKIDLSQFITPLDDRLIVQTTALEKMTSGGLYIPDSVTDSSGNLQGTVVAVGRGRRNKKGLIRPMDVHVGDKIVFSEYAGSKLKYQNEELVILREEDVMGIVY